MPSAVTAATRIFVDKPGVRSARVDVVAEDGVSDGTHETASVDQATR